MKRPRDSGVLVAVEGIDGAGKTTQCNRLAENLRGLGLDVVLSKEPTDGPFGKRLRESAKTGRLSPEDELALFIQDRRQHVETLILPSLQAGKIVILDRYYFSTAAYQGARGIDFRRILELNEEFAPEPDLLVMLDVEPDVGIRRVLVRDFEANEFERKEGLEAARAIFLQIDKPYLFRLSGFDLPELLAGRILDETLRRKCDAISLNPALDQKAKLEMVLQLGGRMSETVPAPL